MGFLGYNRLGRMSEMFSLGSFAEQPQDPSWTDKALQIGYYAHFGGFRELYELNSAELREIKEGAREFKRKYAQVVRELVTSSANVEAPEIILGDELLVRLPDPTNIADSQKSLVVYSFRLSISVRDREGVEQYLMPIGDSVLEPFRAPVCGLTRVIIPEDAQPDDFDFVPLLTPRAFSQAYAHACEPGARSCLISWLFENKVQEHTNNPDNNLIAMAPERHQRFVGSFSDGEVYRCDVEFNRSRLTPEVRLVA